MKTYHPETQRMLKENKTDAKTALAKIDALIEDRKDLPREVRYDLIDIGHALRMQTSVVKFLKKRVALREGTIQRLEEQ